MRSEKRSLAINEIKEVLKSELVTKICGGRVWVVRTVKKEVKQMNKQEAIEKIEKLYEVEKEKYTAKLKSTGEYLHYDTHTCKVHHLFQYDDMAKKSRLYHFTEDELRKYNAWENDVYDVNEVKK